MRSKAMLFSALLWTMAIAVLSGCNRTVAVEDFSAALVELRDEGSVAWNVHADGSVKALVKSRADQAITSKVSGKLVSGDVNVELTQDSSGMLEGKGLKLGADLSPVKYELTVEGKPWNGTLFLPAGGTAELAAGARASANLKLPEPSVGPHGGALQIVGGDVVELVANAATGELRAYVFDAQMRPIAPIDREVKVGLVTDAKAELVALVPDPGGAYLSGKTGIAVDPAEVTIAVKARGQAQAQVVLVGFQPGGALAITATSPRVKIMARVEAPAADTDVNARAEVKGAAGGAVKAGLEVKTPGVKVPDLNANAGAKGSASLKAGIGGVTSSTSSATSGASDGKSVKAGSKLQVKVP